jgi:uncharacterized protein (TIGR01777 family)
MTKRLLIAGGSGLIGTALLKEDLLKEWEITILSRHSGPGRLVWDPSGSYIDFEGSLSFDAIINLAGASISEGRWTEKKKKEIYQSRINACHTIEKYILERRLFTNVYLGASGIGIYGDRRSEIVNENTPIDHLESWLVKTVVDWESAHQKISLLGIRTVILRIGFVLSVDGGALKEILSSPGFGVLAYFGSGKQIWPWIHIEDLTKTIAFCLDHPHVSGTYIAASPHPVTNKSMIETINHYMSPKRIVVPAPKIILSIILGKMHTMLFESCNASSEKIQKEGFVFHFTQIDEALKNLLLKEKSKR